jgi:flagellar biosynthesis protein FlhA
MGEQVNRQLLSNPRALFTVAGVVGVMGLVPGMPSAIFLLLAALLAIGGWLLRRAAEAERTAGVASAEPADSRPAEDRDLSWDDVPPVDLVGLELGYRLIPLVDARQGGNLTTRIKGVRRKLSQELGFLIQPVHIRDNLELAPTAYRISVLGVPMAEAEIQPDRELAINPGRVYGTVPGEPTRDPAFGLEAVWIEPSSREQAQSLGYTVVDLATVVATHLSRILKEHAHELLGHEEVQKLLDVLATSQPKLVESLVPKTVELGVVLKVLKNLLAEEVPIRDMRSIAESLAQGAAGTQDPDALTAHVRVALARAVAQNIAGNAASLPLLALDPALEQILQKSLGGGQGGAALEPGLAERLQSSLRELVKRQEMNGEPSVLVVSPDIRLWLARWLRPSLPGLHVLAYTEIPDNRAVQVVATVGREPAPAPRPAITASLAQPHEVFAR